MCMLNICEVYAFSTAIWSYNVQKGYSVGVLFREKKNRDEILIGTQ